MNFVILEFLPKQKVCFPTNNCSTWFSLEYPPLEFPPFRSANAGLLPENLVADNCGFIEFENSQLMTIFWNETLYTGNYIKIYFFSKNFWIFSPIFLRDIPL